MRLNYFYIFGVIVALCLFTSCHSPYNVQTNSKQMESLSFASKTSSKIENIYESSLNENWMPYSPEEYLAPELPPLTEEELARVNEPVAQEVWGGLQSSITILYIPNSEESHPDSLNLSLDEWASRCLQKSNKEITYGELWRLNNANETLSLWFDCEYEYPASLKEFKSVKSISIRPYSDLNPFDSTTDLSNLLNMTWLEELYIEGGARHNFFRFPAELAQLTHLKKLEMASCQITELADIFDSFPELEVLNLDWNYIAELPPSVYRCKALKVLNLGHTDYTVVPPEISQLKVLEELYLPTQINQLSEQICELSNLKILKFGPPRYREGENTNILYPDKMVHSLPQKIGNLKKLEELYIYFKIPITELPESITDCESLEVIEAFCVKVMPQNMDQLKNLKILQLGTTDNEK